MTDVVQLLALLGIGVAVALAAALLLGGQQTRAPAPEQRLQELVRRGTVELTSRRLPGAPDDPDAPVKPAKAPVNGAGLRAALAGAVENALKGGSFANRLDGRLRKAGSRLQVGEFVTTQISLALGLLVVTLVLLSHNLILLLAAAGVGYYIPLFFLGRQTKQRLKLLEGQLADALSIVANSLRSGYSLLQAMEVVSREMPDPIAKEFAQVLKETRVNIPLEDALMALQARVDSQDFALVITAVLIQRQVGGNLSEVLEKISTTIRDRLQLLGQIRTLTAQGRGSGWIVSLLPFGLGLALQGLNPEYMAPMFHHPVGMGLLGLAGVMQFIGIFVIQKLVSMEV